MDRQVAIALALVASIIFETIGARLAHASAREDLSSRQSELGRST